MTKITGHGELIINTATTIGSAAVNTTNRVNIPQPVSLANEGFFRIACRNTATGSAMTVIVRDRELVDTAGTYCELTRFNVPTAGGGGSRGRVVNVQGWLCGDRDTSGDSGRLDVSNDTAITKAAMASKVFFRVRKV